ncbi:hypothetical protein H8E77_18720 [bacterium]|nr:hypothetical protein [bacterium]
MANFTNPVQIFFSDEQYRRLCEVAKERHKSLASIFRDAVKEVYGITMSEYYVITEDMGKTKLQDYQFYGMWKDRTDMLDSAEWVRRRRENWNERLKRNQL